MKKIVISYKAKNILIEELQKQSNIEVKKKRNFFLNFFSSEKFSDIYFHSGSLDEEAKKNILNSKMVIANSFASMNEVIARTKISHEKIKVIYPSINIEYKNIDELKINICNKLQIDLEAKLILFTAKNFKSSGVKEFLDICSSLTYSNFKIIISGTKQQIYSLKFQLPKYDNLSDKLILLEDYNDINDLFLISDIFILPTYNKSFSSNILKAMFCENVVFVTVENDVKEVVDVFASMDNPNDPTTAFKIDAILLDNEELIKIKKQNREIALEFTLQSNLEKINSIIENV